MKKFAFSLEKLLNYKEQVLQKEKNDLASLRKKLQAEKDSKSELLKKLAEANEDFIEKSSKGMTPSQMSLAKAYIKSISDRIRESENRILLLERSVDKQLGVVVGATKEVSSLEKLQEKQWEEYKHMAQKEEENFIEEYVSNSAFYKN